MAEQKSPFARNQGQSESDQRSPFARNSKPAAVPARRGTKRDATTEVAQFLNEFSRTIPGLDELQAWGEVGRRAVQEAGEGRGGYGLLRTGKMGKPFTPARQSFAEARARQDAMSQDLNVRRPNAAALTRGAGAVIPAGAALATGGAGAAPQVASAPSLLSSVARSASAATVSGAVNRFADRGSVRERLASAADPGAIAADAALGAGIDLGVRAVGKIANNLPAKLSPRERAAKVIGNTRAKPVSVARAKKGDLPFEQAGPKGMTLARAVASVPGEGQVIANATLRSRAQGAPARMNAAVNKTLGNGRAYHSTIDDLMTRRKQNAAPLYSEAYKVGIFPDDFNAQIAPILDTPAGQQAMRNAVQIARNERVPINNIGITIDDNAGTVRFDTVPNMRTLDYVRRGFEDVVDGYRDPVTRKLNLDNAGRAVLNLSQEMKNSLVGLNPKYGEALDAWSGPSGVIDAIRRGRRLSAGRVDPEEINSVVGRMTDAEREGMRIGVARTISDRLRSRNPQNEIRSITNDFNYQDRLRQAFPNQRAFNDFMQQANTEATYQGNLNQVLSGSRTTPLREDIDAVNAQLDESGLGSQIVNALGERVKGTSFVRQAVEAAINKVATSGNRGLNDPEVSRILGEALFTDPRLFNQLLVEQARTLRIPADELSRLVIASATAAPLTLRQPTPNTPAMPY